MSSKISRTVLLALVVLGLMAAVPAFAGQEPAPVAAAQAPTAQAPAVQAQAGCPQAADLFAPEHQAQVCNAPVAVSKTPDFMTGTVSKFTGYCRCGCRFVKDCNTDADCGGGRCLGGVSCC